MTRWFCALLVGAAMSACHSAAYDFPAFPDAPLQLRDDSDRAQAIDALWPLPPGAKRDAARADVAAAIARRLDDALVEEQPVVAEQLVFELASLWQEDPAAVGAGLAPHAQLLGRLRATFARSGALEPAVVTLALLAEVEPGAKASHVAEIAEIVEFARAGSNGDEREIELLAPAINALPLPWLVDRYVGALEARARSAVAVAGPAGRDAPDDVKFAGRRIAAALARSGRAREIAARLTALAAIRSLGDDAALADAAALVTAQAPRAAAYEDLALELAHPLLNSERPRPMDPAAALAVCEAGLAQFPRDAGLLATAAEEASALGRVDQPIALYEAALADGADAATALRLGRVVSERIARLAFGGRPGAARTEWRAIASYADREKGRAPQVWSQVEASAETALGRGLLSQGRIDEAERALTGALDHAPSIDALEALTSMYVKTDRLASATHSATAALALLGDSSGDHYRRAKLERVAGDIMRLAGRSRDAAALYIDSLRAWTTLGDDRGLPRSVAAERKLDVARGMWYLGNSDRAVDLALEATETAPEAGTTTIDAVAFLLEVGKPVDALDAVHRGLDAPELGELDKIYICLWALADARRRGDAKDRQAWDYLASRHGDLWYELLAEAASGRLAWSTLAAAATTEPRQAELAFYGVTLGLDPAVRDPASARKALERAVDAHLVMDAEYDLARQYLLTP